MNDCGDATGLFTSWFVALQYVINYVIFRRNVNTTGNSVIWYSRTINHALFQSWLEHFSQCLIPLELLRISSGSDGVPLVSSHDREFFLWSFYSNAVCLYVSRYRSSYQCCRDLYRDFLETAFRLKASSRGTFVLTVHRHFSYCGGTTFCGEITRTPLSTRFYTLCYVS
jgi:hypothetical protein